VSVCLFLDNNSPSNDNHESQVVAARRRGMGSSIILSRPLYSIILLSGIATRVARSCIGQNTRNRAKSRSLSPVHRNFSLGALSVTKAVFLQGHLCLLSIKMSPCTALPTLSSHVIAVCKLVGTRVKSIKVCTFRGSNFCKPYLYNEPFSHDNFICVGMPRFRPIEPCVFYS
jgi:hypothetical protein